MHRNRLAALTLAIVVLAATPALGASSPPLLGAKAYAPEGAGFGTPYPRKFSTGGDPSGIVMTLTWTHWGDATADGRGETWISKPHGGYYADPGEILLRAYDLGHCGGSSKPAYTRLKIRVVDKPDGKLRGWTRWGGTGQICARP